MLVRWMALFFVSSMLFAPAQRAPMRGGPPRSAGPTLEELRADPPGDWAEQHRQIDEALAIRKLDQALSRSLGGPLALDSAREEYPKLEAARTKMKPTSMSEGGRRPRRCGEEQTMKRTGLDSECS